ncbi:MAG: acylphosphatase [Selenomonadaceae bacterium]|nr:acylphosphatase [Selenomonadaceae bacterium]
MENTIEAIAGQLLLGRSMETVTEAGQRAANEEIIRSVFDKVLIGYSVTGVSCGASSGADGAVQVRVSLVPWDATIDSLEITTEVEGLTPIIANLVRQDLADIETVFRESLIGLPIAASDWTNGVVKKRLNDYMNQRLPEFRADFDIEADAVSRVRVLVYPRVPIVRSVDLCMRSDTLPNFSLLAFREEYEGKVNFLTGVPVAFVRRHEKELAEILEASLDAEPVLKALRAKTKVTITGNERLTVMSRTDSERYHVRIDGWADIGHREKKGSHNSDRDIRFRLRAGYLPNSRNEFFGQLDFYPQDATARFDAGYRYAFDKGQKVWGELRYDFHYSHMTYGMSYDFLPKWRLSYEYRNGEKLGETALRYRLHDFLAVEYAVNKNDNWVRLIGFF